MGPGLSGISDHIIAKKSCYNFTELLIKRCITNQRLNCCSKALARVLLCREAVRERSVENIGGGGGHEYYRVGGRSRARHSVADKPLARHPRRRSGPGG